MLGAPPALANTRFPVASSDVIGREPPEARATDKNPKKQAGWRILTLSQRSQITQSSTEFCYDSVGKGTLSSVTRKFLTLIALKDWKVSFSEHSRVGQWGGLQKF